MRFTEWFTLLRRPDSPDPWVTLPLLEGERVSGMIVDPGGSGYATHSRTVTSSGGAPLASRLFLLGTAEVQPGMMIRREKDGVQYRVRPGSHRRTLRQGVLLTAYWVERVVRPA